jgi:osmotically-inducible protein OsmY
MEISTRPDNTLRPEAVAKARLRDVPRLSNQRIWCECQDGRLFLRGQVPSFYHKQLAQEALANLEGIAQIINDIEVVW